MIASLQIPLEIPTLRIFLLLLGHFQEDKLRSVLSVIHRDFSTHVDTSQVNAQVS